MKIMKTIVTIIIIFFGAIITLSIFKKKERYKIDYPEILGYSICIVAIFIIFEVWTTISVEFKDLKARFETAAKKIENVSNAVTAKIEMDENFKQKNILQSLTDENLKKNEYSKKEIVEKIYDMYKILEEGVSESNELKVSDFFSDEYKRKEGNKVYNKKKEIEAWRKYYGRNLKFLLRNFEEVNEGRIKVTGVAIFLGEGESSKWNFTDEMVFRKKEVLWQCIKSI